MRATSFPRSTCFPGKASTASRRPSSGSCSESSSRRGVHSSHAQCGRSQTCSGPGRVSLPVVFAREPHGGWLATWMHLNLFGQPRFNRVEANYRGTSLLVRGIVERKYLRLSYIEKLFGMRGVPSDEWPIALDREEPITSLGFEYPEDLPAGSTVYTPSNLTELLNST